MKHFLDYLPDYLGGKNIEAHSELIDSMNHDVFQLVNTLSLWDKIEKPIMIERIATNTTSFTINIHINTPEPIKSITITGDHTYQAEYQESDLRQEDLISFTGRIHINNPNPRILVTVETYDEAIYKKGYPENDTSQGDEYDHDEFLSKLGVLLGVPRRIYTEYNWSDALLAEPKCFAKSIIDGVVQSCTEDDYYLQQRILYFIENYQEKTLPEVMLHVRYGYDDIVVMNSYQRRNDPNLTERLRELYQENMDRYRAGTYLILIPESNPVNIEDLTNEAKEEFIHLYTPITRSTSILEPIHTSITSTLESTVNENIFLFHTTLKDIDNNDILESLPIKYDIDGGRFGEITSADPYTSISANTLESGYHYLNQVFEGFMEYAPTETNFLFKTLLDKTLTQTSDSWRPMHLVDPWDMTTITPISIENNQLHNNHAWGYVLYNDHIFDPSMPASNLKIIVRTGFYYNIGFEDQQGLHRELHINGAVRTPTETFRLYPDGRITRNGFPTSRTLWPNQSYHLWEDNGFTANSVSSLFIENQAGHTPSTMIIESVEISQLDSVPLFVHDTQDGVDIYWPRSLYNYTTLGGAPEVIDNPTPAYTERTWQIDISSTVNVEIGLGTIRNPQKYSITVNPQGRKKYDFKLLNGTIYVYEDQQYTGIRFTTELSEILYVYLQVSHDDSIVYDVAYADVTDIQTEHTLTQPQISYSLPSEYVEYDGNRYYQEVGTIDYTTNQSIIIEFTTTDGDVCFGLGEIIVERDMNVLGRPIRTVNVEGYRVYVSYDWEDVEGVNPTDGNMHTLEFRIENGTIYAYLDGEEPSNPDYISYTPQQDEDLYLCIQTYSDSDLDMSWNILSSDSTSVDPIGDDPSSTRVDPLSDELFFDISNWGTFPDATSSSAQTGTPTPATTSDLTIDATAKTISDNNKNYMVYNKTLQDFFDYYGDEFSFIVYKTGGDGRYAVGFKNTTNGGYQLGYHDGYAENTENNSSTSLGEVLYQKYNEITFKNTGTDITIYWKQGGTTYVSQTMSIANLNPSEYYFFFRSSVRTGIRITNDRTKIDYTSRAT